jgi:hypothetical protein
MSLDPFHNGGLHSIVYRMKHDNYVTSFATILSCVNSARVFIFKTCFGYFEPSSGETKYNTPNIQVTTKIVKTYYNKT